jgi:hypothetical protein
MFYHAFVREEVRHSQRFLWRSTDPAKVPDPSEKVDENPSVNVIERVNQSKPVEDLEPVENGCVSKVSTLMDITPVIDLNVEVYATETVLSDGPVNKNSTGQDAIDILDKSEMLEDLLHDTAQLLRKLNSTGTSGKVTNDELKRATAYWIKRSQMESYSEDLEFLNWGKPIPGKSRLAQLAPFVEHGFIKMKTRLKIAENSTGYAEYQLILDPNHQFSELLIDEYYRHYGNQGREAVANEIRKKFWIAKLDAAIRRAFFEGGHFKEKRENQFPPKIKNVPANEVVIDDNPLKLNCVGQRVSEQLKAAAKEQEGTGVIAEDEARSCEADGSTTEDRVGLERGIDGSRFNGSRFNGEKFNGLS